jgi:hypothetical protein
MLRHPLILKKFMKRDGVTPDREFLATHLDMNSTIYYLHAQGLLSSRAEICGRTLNWHIAVRESGNLAFEFLPHAYKEDSKPDADSERQVCTILSDLDANVTALLEVIGEHTSWTQNAAPEDYYKKNSDGLKILAKYLPKKERKILEKLGEQSSKSLAASLLEERFLPDVDPAPTNIIVHQAGGHDQAFSFIDLEKVQRRQLVASHLTAHYRAHPAMRLVPLLGRIEGIRNGVFGALHYNLRQTARYLTKYIPAPFDCGEAIAAQHFDGFTAQLLELAALPETRTVYPAAQLFAALNVDEMKKRFTRVRMVGSQVQHHGHA